MCWAWDERAGSIWWDPSDVWVYFLSPSSSLLFVPVLSFFSWFSHSHLLWSFHFLSSLIPNWPLCFHLPYPHITPLMHEEESPIPDVHTRTQTFQRKHILSICPFAWSIQVSRPILITFLQRQIRQQIYLSPDTLANLSLTNIISFGPTRTANLAWFVGNGRNN